MELFLSALGDWLWSGSPVMKTMSGLSMLTLLIIGFCRLIESLDETNTNTYRNPHTGQNTYKVGPVEPKQPKSLLRKAADAINSAARKPVKPPKALFFGVIDGEEVISEGRMEPELMGIVDLRAWVRRNEPKRTTYHYRTEEEIREKATKMIEEGLIDPKTGQKWENKIE